MAGERSDLGKIFITDGGIYDANTTYEKLTMVSYNNSTYITLRTVTGVTPSNDRINYGLMAQGFTATYLSSVTAEDVQGLVVEAGSETPAQSLINAIADRVANQLVSNSDLQDILSDYILKSAIANNLSITEEGKVLDARQGKALNDALATTNTNVSNLTTAVEQHRTIKKCTINLANSNVITHTAGEAYCYYFNNNYVIVFMTLAFRTNTARAAGTAVFYLSVDGKNITVNEPYNLPCIMTTDNVMKFAGYDFNDHRYFTVPSAWSANTDARYSGVFFASLSS